MKTGAWWSRFERGLRSLTPLVLTLALVLVSVLPLRLPGFSSVTPVVALIAVYHWSIYRPDLLPLTGVFVIGLVQDALAGTPLGLTSLVLLLVQAVVVSQRRFFHGKSFLVEWWGFMLVAPVATLVSWMLASAYFATLITPRPLGFQLLLTVALYPCFTWVFARAQYYLLRTA
ncbi:MAG: rod shape-determining protein MreD [Alphaproteobacteria bacterium]